MLRMDAGDFWMVLEKIFPYWMISSSGANCYIKSMRRASNAESARPSAFRAAACIARPKRRFDARSLLGFCVVNVSGAWPLKSVCRYWVRSTGDLALASLLGLGLSSTELPGTSVLFDRALLGPWNGASVDGMLLDMMFV